MKKFAKKDLLPQAEKLIAQGYKKLCATDDGQFFTDLELATAHAKKIDSEVFHFCGEDFANASEEVNPSEEDNNSGTVTDPEPVLEAVQETVQKAAAEPVPETIPEQAKDPAPAGGVKKANAPKKPAAKKNPQPKKK